MLVVPPNGSRQALASASSAPNAPRAEARRAWRWAVLALALALATLAALSPVALLPPLVWPDGAPVSDTVIHALGFSALGCLLGLLFRFSFLGTLAGLFCLGLFGIGLEVAQGLSGLGRDSDPQDAVANAIGLGLALCITLCLRGMKRLAAAAARVFFETPIPRPAARP
jgi:VanZ family protein